MENDKKRTTLAGLLRTQPSEQSYQMWSTLNDVPQGNDYDMRGFYKGLLSLDPRASAGMNSNDGQMHYPDKWKLPSHSSFSTESMYYDPKTMPNTPTWQGGPIPNGGDSWASRRPDGSIAKAEAPWYTGGEYYADPAMRIEHLLRFLK